MFERHPYSELFGDMPADEYESLVENVTVNGFINPIILIYEGKVLDGWHRYLVSLDTGIEVQPEPFEGSSPLEYVSSANIHRRHLTPAQRAQIVVKHSECLANGSNQYDQKVGLPVDRPTGKSMSTSEMATQAGVGARTIGFNPC